MTVRLECPGSGAGPHICRFHSLWPQKRHGPPAPSPLWDFLLDLQSLLVITTPLLSAHTPTPHITLDFVWPGSRSTWTPRSLWSCVKRPSGHRRGDPATPFPSASLGVSPHLHLQNK